MFKKFQSTEQFLNTVNNKVPFKTIGSWNHINQATRDRADTDLDSEVDNIKLDSINDECLSIGNEGSNTFGQEDKGRMLSPNTRDPPKIIPKVLQTLGATASVLPPIQEEESKADKH